VPDGEFARGLMQGRAAALNLDHRLRTDPAGRFLPLSAGAPELDIVVWVMKAATPNQSSQMAQKVFDACAAHDLHLALVQLPLSWFEQPDVDPKSSEDKHVTCLRSVLMKPQHEAWLDRIWQRLDAACVEAIGQ
jgi:hypothetical protein